MKKLLDWMHEHKDAYVIGIDYSEGKDDSVICITKRSGDELEVINEIRGKQTLQLQLYELLMSNNLSMNMPVYVAYLCDGCDKCHKNNRNCNPECKHTFNIEHAKNFRKLPGINGYIEKEKVADQENINRVIHQQHVDFVKDMEDCSFTGQYTESNNMKKGGL